VQRQLVSLALEVREIATTFDPLGKPETSPSPSSSSAPMAHRRLMFDNKELTRCAAIVPL
jgi:hypothetical protein